MTSWSRAAGWVGCAMLAGAVAWPSLAQRRTPVVEIRPDRIILLDIARAGERLVAVGERGFALLSDDQGRSWRAVATPVTRTLTGVAFRDAKLGVAVGHGASFVRTDDGGATWEQVELTDAGRDSVLGVTHLDGDHFVAYGAFGLYVDSSDGGKTWQRRAILEPQSPPTVAVTPTDDAETPDPDAQYEAEPFDRHISQVIQAGASLLLVAESGILARSDDRGLTWTQLESPYEGSWFGALRVDDGSVLVYGMRGNVFRSADLGASWEKVPLGTTASLMGGTQLRDGRILLVGNAGLLALSGDRARTLELHWSPASRGFAQALEADGRLLTVGEAGVGEVDPAWLTAAR